MRFSYYFIIVMWISVSINLNAVCLPVKKITFIFYNFIVFYRNVIVIR